MKIRSDDQPEDHRRSQRAGQHERQKESQIGQQGHPGGAGLLAVHAHQSGKQHDEDQGQDKAGDRIGTPAVPPPGRAAD